MNTKEQNPLYVPDSIAQDPGINDGLPLELIEELEFLSIVVDEYDQMLQDSEPEVITTSSTAGY